MKPLPPEVSLGQLLDIIAGKKPRPVPRVVNKKPLNEWWVLRGNVRFFSVQDPQAFEREWRDYRAAMPRRPIEFFAMVKESQKRQAQMQLVDQRKAKHRKKYLRRMSRMNAS